MKDLKYYQKIIQDKRKQTEFRDFLMEIVSWAPVVFHRHGKIISRYPKTSRIGGVKHVMDFEKHRDDLIKDGGDYNGDLDFFENLKIFIQGFEFPALLKFYQNENSDFADVVIRGKNIYMSYASIDAKNILYTSQAKNNVEDITSCVMVFDYSNHCYMSLSIMRSNKIFYSKYIVNSNNIWMSSGLIGCSECILCTGLENCSYYIENIKYDQEEYLIKKQEILKNKDAFLSLYVQMKVQGNNHNSTNITGTNLIECEDVESGFNSSNVKNGRNIFLVGGSSGNENMFDTYQAGGGLGDDFYGVCGGGSAATNVFCSSNINGGANIFYSLFMEDSSHCIGCIGLKNKSYCILNKQYTKEEWYKKADEIFSQMDRDGILGDSFPGELNPFYFNDTMAGLLGDFSKEEVEARGYMWRDEEIKVDIPEGSEVIKTSALDDYQGYDTEGNWSINSEILKKVIVDEKGNYYRIVQMEYDFLVKHELPLPEIHWMDRMKLNFGI